VFEEGEAAQVLHEINKVDRTFRLDEFVKHVEGTVAPVITEVCCWNINRPCVILSRWPLALLCSLL
jgi:hypothetical protein